MIKVGLIGFGLSGRVFHAPFIAADDGMVLSQVYSSRKQEVLSAYPDVYVADSAEALIESPELDLIVITSPNELHFSHAKAALEAGKHVLVEKPSVTQLEQIENLTELASQKSLIFCVYQNRRFDGDFLRLKELVASKSVGELKLLESRFDRFRPQVQERWREQPGEGTGIFWDLGPHLLDQALHLMGTPDWIQANIDTLRDGSQTPDRFELELGYKSCRVKLGSSPFEAGAVRRFNAQFTSGSWRCEGLDTQEAALRGGQLPTDAEYPSKGGDQRFVQYLMDSNGLMQRQEVPRFGDYKAFYRALRLAIEGASQAPVSTASACELIYGMNLALESNRLGRKVLWDYSPKS